VTTQVANLGVLLGDIGRFDEAEPLLREAVARAKAHGDARQLAFKQSNLATVLRREGHVAEAIDLLREAERSLSENENPRGMRRAWVLWRLGQALFDAGELTACVDVLRESLEIHRDLFGPGQEEIAIVESWLGSALVARGDYADAAEHLDAALDIHRDLGGPDGAGALEVSRDLAVALAGLGRTCEALELAEGAWEIVRVRNAQDAVVLALHRADLGWCALRAGQLERAAQLSGDTLEALVEHFGDEHPYVVRQRWRMGELEAARASTLR
jgi:tetratricopeptide (TPR) repeat protein